MLAALAPRLLPARGRAFAGLPLLAALVTACDSPFPPASRVEGVRIMAVRSDDPLARPGETVQLTMLVDDGAEKTQISVNGNAVELSKSSGGPIRFAVSGADKLARTDLHLKSRNGYVEPIFGEVSGTSISYDVTTSTSK